MSVDTLAGADARRKSRRLTVSLVSTIIVCLGIVVSVLFVVPGFVLFTDASADAGVVIVERDGRDVAIVVYNDRGANPLDMWITGNSGGLRAAAIDIETGEQVWNTRIADDYVRDRKVIGAAGDHILVRTTAETAVLSVQDGSLVASGDDIPVYTDISFNLGIQAAPDDGEAVLFRLDDDPDGTVRVLDMESLKVTDGAPDLAATWWCAVDWRQPSYTVDFPPIVSNASLGTWGEAEARTGDAVLSFDGSGRLLRTVAGVTAPLGDTVLDAAAFLERQVMIDPLEDACAGAISEEDVFPDGQITSELLGADTDHLLVVADSDGAHRLHVLDAASGAVRDTSSPMLATASAAEGRSGGFVVVAERDLTGIAPAVRDGGSSSVVYTIASDGTIHETILGAHGWFGMPW